MKRLGLATVRMMRQQVLARALAERGPRVAVPPGETVALDGDGQPSVMVRNETSDHWLVMEVLRGPAEFGAPVTVVKLRKFVGGEARVEKTFTGTVVLR